MVLMMKSISITNTKKYRSEIILPCTAPHI